jgi:glycosyltransferase involved in cell wall biosynthesis
VRVLHIETRHRRGGAERNVAQTIDWELSQGFEVHLAVGRDSLESELPAGAETHVIADLVRAVSPVRDLRAFQSLGRLVRRHRFDVVHTHQSKAGVLGRLAARGRAPVILHTIHMASFGPAYNAIASRGFEWAERRCAPSTTRIISVGRELATRYLAAGIGRPDQYEVIRSPIDLTAFHRVRSTSSSERDAARTGFGLTSDLPVALVLASLEPRKRVDLILRALAGRAAAGRIQLLIGGDGPEKEALVGLAQELGIADLVVFAGYLDDTVDAFIAGDVLVHAATVEGVPQVVIQAFAAGLPVAATDMIGLRELDGAPVEIASASGRDLDAAVERALSRLRGEVPEDALRQWSPDAVREALARLYATLPLGGR